MTSIGLNTNYSNYSNYGQQKQDPDAYAQQYATENGLSLEEAKSELKTKFGDPSQGAQIPFLQQDVSIFSSQQNSGNSATSIDDIDLSSYENMDGSSNNIFKTFMGLFRGEKQQNLTSDEQVYQQDPDAYAKEYAEENDITLEEAKDELKALYGEPEKPDTFA